jgi:hypothetical protein
MKCMGEKKEEDEVWGRILALMCGEVFMEKVCAKIKHGKKLWVANTCSKAPGFLVQLVVPPKSTIRLVSNLNRF